MTISVTVREKEYKLPKFPQLMCREGEVYLVTHDQEVGLARTLLITNKKDFPIGHRAVIDDLAYGCMSVYEYAVTLENR